MSNILHKTAIVLLLFVTLSACDENNNLSLFSIENDIELGEQIHQEIMNDPSFKVLSPNTYSEEYAYLNQLTNEILNSGEITYLSEFKWKVTILKDDDMLNAFATPGGYIYVYTGLIKYLNSADALAGVMAHEIAHADLRHSSRTLQKQYGLSILLSAILGNDPSTIAQIAAQIAGTTAGLSFSRDYEEEADMQSVEYLSNAPYACNGAAIFFQRLQEEGQDQGTPEFLSTHPSPENRVEDINAKAAELACSTNMMGSGYQEFKDGL
jgi:predicted Zn-dependent protease